jgi:hypothetical protein
MTRVGLLVVVFAVAAAAQDTAAAQTPTRDSISGTVTLSVPPPIRNGGLIFSVSSGPSGENPTGTVTVALLDFNVVLDFQVTCLAVNGNAATVGSRHVDPGLGEQLAYMQVVDGGPGAPDQIGTVATGSALACAKPPLPFVSTDPITSGDITVVDAPALPTSKDQCKDGGWRNFPRFKNQGDCMSFVATGGKKPTGSPG